MSRPYHSNNKWNTYMDESRIHGLHRIGEVLEALYPELLTQINHKNVWNILK